MPFKKIGQLIERYLNHTQNNKLVCHSVMLPQKLIIIEA